MRTSVYMRIIDKLLMNEEFIKWVKNPTIENDLFWREWLEGNPDKVDDFNKAKNLIRKFDFKKAPKDDERFNRVLKNILLEQSSSDSNQRNQKKKLISLSIETVIKIAAVIVFALTFTFILKINQPNADAEVVVQKITKQSSLGQKLTFILPDSTVVILNSGSRINFPEKFTNNFRDVELEGEAFFEVSENKQVPFRVETQDIEIVALGTSFNVRAYQNDAHSSISLNSGKVEICGINDQLEESCILIPGEKVTYNSELRQMDKSQFDPELELSWKDGILVFKHTNLSDFIQTIERWYGVNIELIGNSDFDICVTGRFENNESLEFVLGSLEFSREREFEHKFIDNKNVELRIKT